MEQRTVSELHKVMGFGMRLLSGWLFFAGCGVAAEICSLQLDIVNGSAESAASFVSVSVTEANGRRIEVRPKDNPVKICGLGAGPIAIEVKTRHLGFTTTLTGVRLLFASQTNLTIVHADPALRSWDGRERWTYNVGTACRYVVRVMFPDKSPFAKREAELDGRRTVQTDSYGRLFLIVQEGGLLDLKIKTQQKTLDCVKGYGEPVDLLLEVPDDR